MAALDKIKILVLCGPTATGKTALSVALAKRLHGEIISADSMQLYKRLTIGTAKATPEEMQGVPHHLVDFLPLEKRFSVAEYVGKASACIDDIAARGKLPIVVGGTGQYIESLIKGMRFTQQPTDLAVREKLQQQVQTQGIGSVYAQLLAADPAYAQTLHPNNQKRVLRAMELYLQTGCTMSQQLEQSLPAEMPYDAHVFALTCADRQQLYTRINTRVDSMVQQGILAEARLVYSHQTEYITAAQAIGYKEFFPYFEANATLEECTEKLKQASRNYAKRQLTWFKRMENITWLEAGCPENENIVITAL